MSNNWGIGNIDNDRENQRNWISPSQSNEMCKPIDAAVHASQLEGFTVCSASQTRGLQVGIASSSQRTSENCPKQPQDFQRICLNSERTSGVTRGFSWISVTTRPRVPGPWLVCCHVGKTRIGCPVADMEVGMTE